MDIVSDQQNIDELFSGKTYHIDFYQRDYKWTKEPVLRLLNDIFYQFNATYAAHPDLEPGKKTATTYYSWYYLNTYVTNTIEGKIYIVDGQQRLTTLSLILIKLKHLGDNFNSKLTPWINNKVAGISGYETEFWMNHERQMDTLTALFKKNEAANPICSKDITTSNLLANYQTISTYLEEKLNNLHAFETFTFFFILRLVLIKLSVEQTDVPMIFEVINDRGVRLKPYEILKGKLLGQIDKHELKDKSYNNLWDTQVDLVNAFKADEIDTFFISYLKAKFVKSRSESQRFDKEYHREIFKPDMNKELELERNAIAVKQFLEKDFTYFTSLYVKAKKLSLKANPNNPFPFFNNLNEMDAQYRLILSACKLNDPEEDSKLFIIPRELDRLFTLLQLQGSYDSNKFTEVTYQLAEEIRNKPSQEIKGIFEKYLVRLLEDRRQTTVTNSFQYAFFKRISTTDLNSRFIRYFFARIDHCLASGMKQEMKYSFADLVKRKGPVNGFHIEHILSHNTENVELFANDKELFEIERNRLGGILLLKGRDNISSSNEQYKEKLKTYTGTLYWNETLCDNFYKSNLDFKDFCKKEALQITPLQSFGPDELELRQVTLFDLASKIWN